MAVHATKARRNWLGVARVSGRLGLALGIPLAMYLLVYRPQQLRWGATDAEVARAMARRPDPTPADLQRHTRRHDSGTTRADLALAGANRLPARRVVWLRLD